MNLLTETNPAIDDSPDFSHRFKLCLLAELPVDASELNALGMTHQVLSQLRSYFSFSAGCSPSVSEAMAANSWSDTLNSLIEAGTTWPASWWARRGAFTGWGQNW